MNELPPYRLPRTVVPRHYDLVFKPDFTNASFDGEAAVEVEVLEATDEVVLNAAELEVSEARLVGADGRGIEVTVTYRPEEEQLVLGTPEALAPGPWRLDLRFAGRLNDRLRGFYRSKYKSKDGEETWLAATQFESTDARRAFPCWDEPDFKATFGVTVVAEDGLTVLGNAREISSEVVEDGKRRTRFADTLPMSTYIVAVVIGPFELSETRNVDGVPLRIGSVPGRGALRAVAEEAAVHALSFLSSYFSMPYPADKLDHVGIPDFAAGAMENLGCITYRESALLVDPATAARTELERVADVICHEVAHMWFGDLVTMGWWEGIWLNEAFATFMEMLCVDAFRPSWDRWVGFAPSREAALAVDGVHSTRPIEYPVGPPKEAEGMFDLLTYEKGCGVLRMLEQHIGADVFRDGVRTYLKAHAYGNTVTNDLWNALEDASGAPVRDVMNTFILQGGHPLVSLHGDALSQQPFSFGPPPPGVESSIGDVWNVPIAVRALPAAGGSGAPVRHLVLGPEPTRIDEAHQGLAVLNAGGWGVFRVGYENEHRLALAEHLPELTPLERANLLSDTWATTLAGLNGLREFIVLASRLGLEPDPAPWASVGSALILANRIALPEDEAAVHEAAAALLGPTYRNLGFDAASEEGDRTPSLRSLAINLMGTVGADAGVRNEAARRFDASPIGGGSGPAIPADIESATLAVVAQLVRPGDYDALLERYRSASTPQEEMRSLGALASFPDVDLCLRTFDLALTEVRTQNGFSVIAALLANRVGNQAVWTRITETWDIILERFPKNAPPRILDSLPALCADVDFARGAIAFLKDHPLASGPRRVAQSAERLNVNVAFAARERPGLADSLRAAGTHSVG